jgi:hypothetical protein
MAPGPVSGVAGSLADIRDDCVSPDEMEKCRPALLSVKYEMSE